jgi:hypothetical protein
MSKTFRQFILFGAPLFVGIINLFHPVHFEPTGVYEPLHNKVDWWIMLHLLNLAGFPLIALAAFQLLQNQQGPAAKVAWIALAIFIPTYAGFDSIIGIGTGNLIQYAKTVPLDQLPALENTIDAYWRNNVSTALAIIGSVAWSIGMLAIALELGDSKKRPALLILGVISGAFTGVGYSTNTFGTFLWWIGVFMIGLVAFAIAHFSLLTASLILAGVLFGTTHVVPYGPLGMACIILASIMLETRPAAVSIPRSQVTSK